MPPKSRRRKQLEEALRKAREKKKAKVDNHTSAAAAEEDKGAGGRSSDSEVSTDPSYDPAEDLSTDANLRLEQFAEEWVVTLDREDKVSLALFLCYHLEHLFGHSHTKAAEYTGMMLGKSDRTVRQWRHDFMEKGEIAESKQGKYQRTGVLWSSEDLNEKATKFLIHANAAVKGQPSLTSAAFCQWVNEDLLPNSKLEPGFPSHIGIETARKWLHELSHFQD